MRNVTTIRIALAAALVLGAASAWCQPDPAFVVVCTGSGCDDYPDLPTFADLEQAVAQAKALANLENRHYTVLVTEGTWPANVTIFAGEDIGILGVSGLDLAGVEVSAPQEVIVEGKVDALPVLDLDGAGESVVIEGLTLRGGRDGVWVHGGSQAIIDRCYILDNSEHGVRCEGSGTATLIINCGIVANGQDGLNVAEGNAEILHCSIIGNAGNGVYVANGAGARARNTLVYHNGGGGELQGVSFTVRETASGLPGTEVESDPNPGRNVYAGGGGTNLHRLLGPKLGLSPGDEIDALSYGDPEIAVDIAAGGRQDIDGNPIFWHFSVHAGSQGLPGTAVDTEVTLGTQGISIPANPPEAHGDYFYSSAAGVNTLAGDEEILGLRIAGLDDELSGLDLVADLIKEPGPEFQPGQIFFSLVGGADILTPNGAGGYKIAQAGDGVLTVDGDAATLGIVGQDLDALFVDANGAPFFSINAAIGPGVGPGDILVPDGMVSPADGVADQLVAANDLGLASADDLDALDAALAAVTAPANDPVVFSGDETGFTASGSGGLNADPGATVTVDYNNVYDNNSTPPDTTGPNNYINVGIGPNSINPPEDPDVLSSPWRGKLTGTSPLIGRATGVSDPAGVEEHVDVDFEGEQRPSLSPVGPPDIGADEYWLGGAIGSWYFCEVIPSPVTELAAGDLSVEVRVSGAGVGTVFIVPQGGDVILAPHRIPMSTVLRLEGGRIWHGTNAATIANPWIDADGDGGISQGDLLVDGHAAVYITFEGAPGEIVGNDYNPPFDEGGVIRGQALEGRHFIIDTLPARMKVPEQGVWAYQLVPPGLANDVWTVNDVVAGVPPNPPQYPFPSIPSGFRQADEQAPWDNEPIRPDIRNDLGAQIFFNVASSSNNLALANLDITVGVDFEDPNVYEYYDVIPMPDTGGAIHDRDLFMPLAGDTARQVSGFDDVSDSGTVQQILLGDQPVQWLFWAGSDRPSNVIVTGNYTAVTANPGFFPLGDNKEVAASWTFEDEVTGDPGIPVLAVGGKLHVATRFRGRDLAGNLTGQDDVTELLDPLHIWWLRDTKTVLSPNWEGRQVDRPWFQWKLDRGYQPNESGQPRPLFTYRLWEGNSSWHPAADPCGPGGSWAAWSPTVTGLAPGWFEALRDSGAITRPWLLLVVVGADEAGNVRPWPPELELVAGDNIERIYAGSGPDWQRFEYVTAAEALDTTVTATFWHNTLPANAQIDGGEQSFGAATVVPWPADPAVHRIEVKFDIGLVVPDPGDLLNATVEWELAWEGDFIASGTPGIAAMGRPTVTLIIPLDTSGLPILGELVPGLPPITPVPYVFRAWTVSPIGEDSTPATCYFTVVPGSVDQYVEPKDRADDQPIKIQELE